LFIVLFAFLIASQIGLFFWKKKHYRSFQNVTLLGLWLIPSLFAFQAGFWRMLSVWSFFSVITGFLIYSASQSPLYKETPSRVYGWFYLVYRLSYVLTIVGYVLVMLEFVGVTHFLIVAFGTELFHSFSYVGALLLFYGLYFGVLGRDCAEMCTDRLASVMGFTGKGLPSKSLPPRTCCICGDEYNPETAVKLNCSHQFHEGCIRGWTIIGKKDTCPYCSEKVQLKQLFNNPWEKQGILWANLLDSLRYLIVWNPVILTAVQLFLYIADG
jgi:RING finger protein 121